MALTNVDLYRIDGTIGSVSNVQTAAINGGPIAGTRNRIINGDMRIDQRNAGALVTASLGYPVDRFFVQTGSDAAFSYQRDTNAPTGFSNSLKVTTTTADTSLTSGQYNRVVHNIEGFNTQDFLYGTASAKTVTLSFWVRSSITGTHGGSFRNNAGDRSYPFSYSISAANTWEYKTITITGETTGTWLTDNGKGLEINWSLGTASDMSGTAGAWGSATYLSATGATGIAGTLNATWYLSGVQCELGSVATPFERRSYGQELALCQRYCYQLGRAQAYTPLGYGFATSTTVAQVPIILPIEMRTSPSSITTNGSWQLSDGLAAYAITTFSVPGGQSSPNLLTIQATAAGGGMAAYRPIRVESANSTASYILIAAEL